MGVGEDIREITRVAAGDEGHDRVEVLAVGLHGVHGRLTGAPIDKAGGEACWSRNVNAVDLGRKTSHATTTFVNNRGYPSLIRLY
jgi:hypothetical protein